MSIKPDKQCTMWPDGNWNQCCVQHDYDYADQNGRIKSDWKLAKCVWNSGALGKINAPIMFTGLFFTGWINYNRYGRLKNSIVPTT